jgi:hypothetical protein
MFYARLIGSEKTFQGETLPLDIVPSGKPCNFARSSRTHRFPARM